MKTKPPAPMKITITTIVDPTRPEPLGTAQRLIEQAAVAIATGSTTGKMEKTAVIDKDTKVIGTVEFTVADK